MKKDLGLVQAVYPMPVLMVAAYDENEKVNAPIIEEFPVVMECELLEFLHTEYVDGIVGRIVNVKAEEAVLSDEGKVDPAKLHALMFDQFQNGYYSTGAKVGQAWNAGVDLMKK